MKNNDLCEINNFFRYRKGRIGQFREFKRTGLYEHHANLFGHLTFTEDQSINYIAVDKNGFLYDETYYPYPNIEKIGTIVPIHLYEQNYKKVKSPSPIWKDVAEKGYGIVDGISIPKDLKNKCLEEGFIPHGYNKNLDIPTSIHHAYFDSLKETEPEKTIQKDYTRDITNYLINKIPKGQTLINNWDIHTSNIKKYIYEPADSNSIKGPYSFHMDYYPRCLFMFFAYISKNPQIDGRDLLVGKREDFKDFSREALDFSPDTEPSPESPFGRLSDDKITDFNRIKISSSQIIIMNTLNPLFVHKVEKLKSSNEVILIANYAWCKYRKYSE